MHSRSVYVGKGFGHECCVKPVRKRNLLNHESESNNIVGCLYSVRILEIDLMLPGSNLVMCCLNFVPHWFQHQGNVPPCFLSSVYRWEVDITSLVVRFSDRISGYVYLKQEKFRFRASHYIVSQFFCPFNLSFQQCPRATGKMAAVRVHYVTHQPTDPAMFGNPWKHCKCFEIGYKDHVRFFNSRETLDRWTIEHHSSIESFAKLAFRNFNILDDSIDICEL